MLGLVVVVVDSGIIRSVRSGSIQRRQPNEAFGEQSRRIVVPREQASPSCERCARDEGAHTTPMSQLLELFPLVGADFHAALHGNVLGRLDEYLHAHRDR